MSPPIKLTYSLTNYRIGCFLLAACDISWLKWKNQNNRKIEERYKEDFWILKESKNNQKRNCYEDHSLIFSTDFWHELKPWMKRIFLSKFYKFTTKHWRQSFELTFDIVSGKFAQCSCMYYIFSTFLFELWVTYLISKDTDFTHHWVRNFTIYISM